MSDVPQHAHAASFLLACWEIEKTSSLEDKLPMWEKASDQGV